MAKTSPGPAAVDPSPGSRDPATVATDQDSSAPTRTRQAPTRLRGTLYRGREGMWSWVMHRISGVAIFFFLVEHVLSTSLVRVSPEAYNAVIGSYKTPIVGLFEVALVAAVSFHALNGLRIILIDFWSKGTKYQRVLFWIVIGLFLLIMIGFTPRHLINVFGEVG